MRNISNMLRSGYFDLNDIRLQHLSHVVPLYPFIIFVYRDPTRWPKWSLIKMS